MPTETKFWKKYNYSKSLADLYVYYERLNETHPRLYETTKNQLRIQKTDLESLSKSSAGLRLVAEREKQKELSLLNKVFGQNLIIDWDDPKSVRNFLDTFNNCLGFKAVYERNKALILSKSKKKSVISYFPTYFIQAWKAHWPDMWKDVLAQHSFSKNLTYEELFEKEIQDNMDILVVDAIERMFNASPEFKTEMQEYYDAYKPLLEAIGHIDQKNSFAQQVMKIYGLDTFASDLVQQMKNNSQGRLSRSQIEREFSKSMPKTKLSSLIKANQPQKGGLTQEAFTNLVVSNLKGSSYKVEAYRSGPSEVKPDNIITFDIDVGPIEDIISEKVKITRENNLEKFEKVYQHLKEIDNGFIVYANEKNYQLDGYRFLEDGGFSADSSLTARALLSVIKHIDKNARTLVGVLLNTASGAIGQEENVLELVAQNLAQDIAMMLFDDYQSIGDHLGAKGATAIHMINLNGIYIPLSFLLTLVAKSIEELERIPEKLIKVSISTPSILYKTAEEQSEAQSANGWGPFEAWRYQRNYALDNTKISYHFLKNFRDIVTKYLS